MGMGGAATVMVMGAVMATIVATPTTVMSLRSHLQRELWEHPDQDCLTWTSYDANRLSHRRTHRRFPRLAARTAIPIAIRISRSRRLGVSRQSIRLLISWPSLQVCRATR